MNAVFAGLVLAFIFSLLYGFSLLRKSSEHIFLAVIMLFIHFTFIPIFAYGTLSASHCTYDVVNETQTEINKNLTLTTYDYDQVCSEYSETSQTFFYIAVTYSVIGTLYLILYALYRVFGIFGWLSHTGQQKYKKRYQQ